MQYFKRLVLKSLFYHEACRFILDQHFSNFVISGILYTPKWSPGRIAISGSHRALSHTQSGTVPGLKPNASKHPEQENWRVTNKEGGMDEPVRQMGDDGHHLWCACGVSKGVSGSPRTPTDTF